MRSTFPLRTACAVVPLALFLLLVAGCHGERFDAVWLPDNSGRDPEWDNLASYRFEELNGILTVTNDESMLLLRFRSRDRGLMPRFERQGLQVWLTGANGKTERLGIHYPLGVQGGQPPLPSDRFLPNDASAPDVTSNLLAYRDDEFEILLGDSTWRLSATNDSGHGLGVGATLARTTSGDLEYVLRISMGRLVSWIKPGARLKVEVESAAMKRPSRPDGDEHGGLGGGGPPGGGMGGGGRPGGGMGGGGRPGGGMGGPGGGKPDHQGSGISATDPIHLKFEIVLATG